MAQLIIRADPGKRAYRLRCRFVIDAAPAQPYFRQAWERELEKAKYETAERFVRDMAKKGWEYLGRYPWRFRGPFPVMPIVTLPRRSQSRWHIPSRELLAAVQAGYRPVEHTDAVIRDIPVLSHSDRCEYELSAVFIHKTILVEVPDREEEIT